MVEAPKQNTTPEPRGQLTVPPNKDKKLKQAPASPSSQNNRDNDMYSESAMEVDGKAPNND